MKKLFSIIFVAALTSAAQAQTLEIFNSEGKKVKTYKAEDIAFVEPFAYGLNVSIEGPGNVNEFLVGGKKLELGSKVNLKATPMQGYKFMGWEGSLAGNNPDTTITIDSFKNIVAKFGMKKLGSEQFPLPDLKQPWHYLGKIYEELNAYPEFNGESQNFTCLPLDYNRDGYLDCVVCHNNQFENKRSLVKFYLGDGNGEFVIDETNSDKFEGLVWPRKMVYGDYNNDGYPDICLIGHGYDGEPWPGEYPVILFSSPSGVYSEVRFTELVSYFHGGTSGDFDNDGDLDIFLISNFGDSMILENDGNGNFTSRRDIYGKLYLQMFNTEFFDLNHDGNLDLIVGGHDFGEDFETEESKVDPYYNRPVIIWGNGKTFNHDNYIRFPKYILDGYGVVCDFYFYDINKDGEEEIIVSRTGDGHCIGGSSTEYYLGCAIQVLKKDNETYVDATTEFFDDYCFPNNICQTWLDIHETNGEIRLITSAEIRIGGINGNLSWTFVDGKFKLDREPEIDYNKAGFLFDFNGWWCSDENAAMSSNDVHSGTSCIEWIPTGLQQWFGINCDEPLDKENLVYWIENNYSLEMFIKAPENCRFYVSFMTEDIRNNLEFDLNKFPKEEDGWVKVQTPLSAFSLETGYYGPCPHVSISFSNYGGDINKPIYIDDIRVRKIL